ncbi:hypothetical protein F5Y14DRAFT_463938 [Nemania sp. NC0429]|nr:hypothetical protein F5Y14DRAFT_463938 [Nemania sp. NC0429]
MCPGVLIDSSPGSGTSDEYFDRHQRFRHRAHTESEITDRGRLVTSPVEINGQPNNPGPIPFANGDGVEELGDRPQASRPPHPEVNFIRFTNPHSDRRFPSIRDTRIYPMFQESDSPGQRRRNGTLSVRTFIRVQLGPLLLLLREHLRVASRASELPQTLSSETQAITSIVGYLQIALTLANQLP